MSLTYTAELPLGTQTVARLAALLVAERERRGTRAGTRRLSCWEQAVFVLRWFWDVTRLRQLCQDHRVSRSVGYRYLHEGIAVLASQAPDLRGALLAAKATGYDHVIVDGTLIETDRVYLPGPTPGVDPVVVGKSPQSRRQHPGRRRTRRRLATVDLRRSAPAANTTAQRYAIPAPYRPSRTGPPTAAGS
jgi:hypothetical protein